MLRSVESYQTVFCYKLISWKWHEFTQCSTTSIKVQRYTYQIQYITVFVTNIGVRLKEQPKHDWGGGLCSSLPPALRLSLPLKSSVHTFMFTGATCEIQIDECQSQPCLNGARCHDYTDGFACICPSGFQGHKCEFNTDECQEQPCKNGAPCVDGVNGCEITFILLLQRQKVCI